MANLTIFSKALYSTWAYHSPSRTLFDCGEGCATALTNNVYAPERVLISHGHGDHVLGLPSLIGCRNSGRGDRGKPLYIYAPESDSFTSLKKFILERNSHLRYSLDFNEVNQDTKIHFTDKMYIQAFPVTHTYNSFGYKIIEIRNRLKSGILPENAKKLKESGIDIYEKYEIPSFVWLLDSVSFDIKHIENAIHVVFDSTFLKAKDRDNGNTHGSMEEVLVWARDANVKRATLAHISTRYTDEEIIKSATELTESIGYKGVVDVILGGKTYDI